MTKRPAHVVYRAHLARVKARESRQTKRLVITFDAETIEKINAKVAAAKTKRWRWLRKVILEALK